MEMPIDASWLSIGLTAGKAQCWTLSRVCACVEQPKLGSTGVWGLGLHPQPYASR
jgi:hypothetical protein